jgi:hypothetical protein
LDFAVDMKVRLMFLLSLILMVGALFLVFRWRGLLNLAFRAWHRGDPKVFQQFVGRGLWFIFPAWALAVGGGACLFASYRRRERAWRWAAVVLLALFLFFALAPA